MKTATILKYVLMAICAVIFSIGIYINHSHYRLIEWIVMLSIMLIFIIIIFISFTAIESDIKRQKEKEKKQSYEVIETTDAATAAEAVSQAQYIETTNGRIMRADGKAFTDEELPFLIQRSYEKSLIEEEVLKKVNPKFNRTDCEEKMAFDFAKKNEGNLFILEKRFQNLYHDAYYHANGLDDLTKRIEILESAATAFKQAQSYCYEKGLAGKLYFQDTWEYMHNSQNPCFSYLDNIIESINETKRTRDVVIPAIFDVIEWHDGILQKDIYALLPDIDKKEIQGILIALHQSAYIIRIKKGNTYELHINK